MWYNNVFLTTFLTIVNVLDGICQNRKKEARTLGRIRKRKEENGKANGMKKERKRKAAKMSTIQLLVGDQIDVQFFYIILLFQSSTCFEQTRAHHQEVNCINTASGIVTVCKWPSGTGRPLTESDYARCCINTVDLLMMSTCLLETCRRLK